ncbi:MAG: hypothetical protein LRZ84_00540 [Desertifilum sp.]|nr:hypothetical protein [Desertifilum sp.]
MAWHSSSNERQCSPHVVAWMGERSRRSQLQETSNLLDACARVLSRDRLNGLC